MAEKKALRNATKTLDQLQEYLNSHADASLFDLLAEACRTSHDVSVVKFLVEEKKVIPTIDMRDAAYENGNWGTVDYLDRICKEQLQGYDNDEEDPESAAMADDVE